MVDGEWWMVNSGFYSPLTGYYLLAEDFDHFPHRGGEAVNLLLRVVEGEGGAGRGRHFEVLHDGLRAVVAGADGDALAVEDGAHVVRMHLFDDEGEDARLVARVADDADALDGR